MSGSGSRLSLSPGDVYCGRGPGGVVPPPPRYGWLGNPCRIGSKCPECGEAHRDGGSTLECYETYLRRQLKNAFWMEHFRKAALNVPLGNLRCFCKDKSTCHTSIIFKLAQEMAENFPYKPHLDGKNHINIYSRAKTELGRFLSNFARSPFSCEDGHFESVEGYWFWLSSAGHPDREDLRDVHGAHAKKLGTRLREESDSDRDPDFEVKIKRAISQKLMANSEMLKELVDSTLPLVHYFSYGSGHGAKVVYDGKSDWIMDFFEEVRSHFRGKV